MSVSPSTINKRVIEAEYAVRGAIVARASVLNEELKAGKKFPFTRMIFCNIGNPQAVGQVPLTFPRQVSTLVTAPELLTLKDIAGKLPPDVIARAKSMLSQMGNTGGYTDSAGYAFVRKNIASFIDQRDAQTSGSTSLPKCLPSNIYLTNGASQGVTFLLQFIINGLKDGIMIPIPQYPLYTATLTLLDGTAVPYYLNEAKGWSISVKDLDASYAKATAAGVVVRAIVVINPGNPTGQILDRETMQEVVQWAHSKRVLIMADEVYQNNVYSETKKFHSFREVLLSQAKSVATETQLVSFHSASKGIHGECGRRGGYMEVINISPELTELFVKLPSIGLCPNIMGQIMMDLIVAGPKPGDASYPAFKKEYDATYASLKERAVSLPKALRKVPGITCNDIEGAMYAFPRIRLPRKFLEECAAKKQAPDAVWCMGLVEQEGIVTVPGSGFRQEEGTLHFRTTILPPNEQMVDVARRIDAYQRRIIAKYGAPVESSKL